MARTRWVTAATHHLLPTSDASFDLGGFFDLPVDSSPPIPRDPLETLETAVKGLYRKIMKNPSYSAIARHCRDLESLMTDTKNQVAVSQVGLSSTLSDRYSEGYEDGRSAGYKEGLEEGRKAAEDEVRRSQASTVESGVQTLSPATTTTNSTQTDTSSPADTRSCAVQAWAPLDWASEPLDPAPAFYSGIAPPTQNPPTRDFSALRSEQCLRPFSTLQRRSRRVRARRSYPPRHDSRHMHPGTSSPAMSSVLPWDTDPRLISLASPLRSLGWTRVRGHGEDAVHVWKGAGGRIVT
ncbi:hypothetical protein K466DRAFT_607740 [Polyporus arcularius HHB13444]|uniref:Uncharacterized protein n=1 Tax=Polyporus arcularius HHB13444 TaxID=1314778 RepID=A0A5C3NJU8_9APHY|nr:hypothetical protein K466DRAFT_607740 [Polyporus arcularius HHB13444]